MCWNPDISINTFVFGLLSLIFLFFTNMFSKYKIKSFSNSYLYLFLLEIISVQLVEFFLWKNLDNKQLNKFLTLIILLLVGSQPPTLMMLIKEPNQRNTLLFIYGLFVLGYLGIFYLNQTHLFYTSVAKNGHLHWGNTETKSEYNRVFMFMYLIMYLLPLFFVGNYCLSILVIISMVISLYFYLNDGTFGSMWCWMANFSFLFLLVYVLIVLPFYEYNGLC